MVGKQILLSLLVQRCDQFLQAYCPACGWELGDPQPGAASCFALHKTATCDTEGGCIRPNLSATFPEQATLNLSLSPYPQKFVKLLESDLRSSRSTLGQAAAGPGSVGSLHCLCTSRAQAARPAAPRTATRPRRRPPTEAPPLSFVWAPLSSAQLSGMGVGCFHRGFPRGPPVGSVGLRVLPAPFLSRRIRMTRVVLPPRGSWRCHRTVAFSLLALTGSDPHPPGARPGLQPGPVLPAARAALTRAGAWPFSRAAPGRVGCPAPSR